MGLAAAGCLLLSPPTIAREVQQPADRETGRRPKELTPTSPGPAIPPSAPSGPAHRRSPPCRNTPDGHPPRCVPRYRFVQRVGFGTTPVGRPCAGTSSKNPAVRRGSQGLGIRGFPRQAADRLARLDLLEPDHVPRREGDPSQASPVGSSAGHSSKSLHSSPATAGGHRWQILGGRARPGSRGGRRHRGPLRRRSRNPGAGRGAAAPTEDRDREGRLVGVGTVGRDHDRDEHRRNHPRAQESGG